MAMTITGRNVNDILHESMKLFRAHGFYTGSRNGEVIRIRGPVLTTYIKPTERVLFSPERDANPFFHFFEALWMLAGRDDVEFPAHFVGRIRNYSDDGTTLHGAYGKRWRFFPRTVGTFDQLRHVTRMLRNSSDTRRVVVAMWHAPWDLSANSKDLPCNTHVYFDPVNDGTNSLDMTICCRSNDAIWGAHGANAVHFSMLHEYVARQAGMWVGFMHQLSNNYHVYTENYDPLKIDFYPRNDHYSLNGVEPYPLMGEMIDDGEQWDEDLDLFLSDPEGDSLYKEPFFEEVAAPMFAAHAEHKRGNTELAITTCGAIKALDWKIACMEWLQRRLNKEVT